jgi:uncharacterized protein (TIGR03083 family)
MQRLGHGVVGAFASGMRRLALAPLGRIDTRDPFPAERRALLALLAELTDEEWFRPTVCSGWTVHDVALHLLGVDVQFLSGGRDSFGGPPGSVPTGDLTDWATLVAYINGRNAVWVEATRRISPRRLRELLAFTGEAIAAYLATVDMEAFGIPVSWADPGPAPTWLHIAREYTERWTHQQHIRDAVGKPGFTEPRFFAPVLDAFARALPYTLRDTPAAPRTRLRLVVTGAAGGRWTALRGDETWALDDDQAAPSAATVTIDQDAAWRLFTKGLDPSEADRLVAVAGDRALAAPVVRMVTIIA